MPVTIKDIARAAGVSHATVSRALNGNAAIPEGTAESIRDLARSMGYVPSAAARGLKTNRSKVLGVIVSRIDNPYFGEVVQGIEDVVKEEGYSIFLASSDQGREQERSVVQAFGEHRVDGAIIGSVSFTPEHLALLKEYHVPIVVLNNQSPEEFTNSISHDDIYGGEEVTRYLLSLGHKRVAYIGNNRAGRINHDRLTGYRKALAAAGIKPDADLVVNTAGSDIDDGIEGMSMLMKQGRLPDAVFCFNDLMAIGALKLLQKEGIRVPQQLSLAGFDNIEYSAYTSPALTTFDQPKRLIGSEAARLLLSLIGNGEYRDSLGTPTHLVRGRLLIRESTAHFHAQEEK